ncbi:hypothetical protein T10_3138 [Trichinella papuae]|uniref:Uncharacterized protein n=1 Tax=Trichinella papuae TaxID=268474 RepID=A0A0V1MQE6_9BILA|nr:hypothetical protein T10_3138 [Trichinella papuae]
MPQQPTLWQIFCNKLVNSDRLEMMTLGTADRETVKNSVVVCLFVCLLVCSVSSGYICSSYTFAYPFGNSRVLIVLGVRFGNRRIEKCCLFWQIIF